MFSSFPHRHGDATGKPATRDKTRGCRKTSISYEISSNFHNWQHNKRTSFAASPKDTARPRENQTRETRQVGAPKRAFRARLPPIFTLCIASKSTFSYEASVNFQHIAQNATTATEFAPCRHLTQPCQCDLQKNTQHDTSKVLRLPRKCPKCCACHENCNTSSENVTKVLRLPRKTIFNTLQNTSECHEVPRLPRETKQRHV